MSMHNSSCTHTPSTKKNSTPCRFQMNVRPRFAFDEHAPPNQNKEVTSSLAAVDVVKSKDANFAAERPDLPLNKRKWNAPMLTY